ncbi:hypothetical protein FRB98_007520 [Tulasnella sp. 332]|nr:hypothetical protein FRB98_007520 [Tulasnella sp. 332]
MVITTLLSCMVALVQRTMRRHLRSQARARNELRMTIVKAHHESDGGTEDRDESIGLFPNGEKNEAKIQYAYKKM